MLTRLVEMVSIILSKSLDYEDDDWGMLKRELTEQLEGRGFLGHEIDIAFEVANRIRIRIEDSGPIPFPFKTNMVYSYLEELKLTRAARGFLMQLAHDGAITPIQREEIVERAFFLDGPEVDIDDMQFLVNFVLGGDSWPGEESPSMTYTLQ